jgi:hypothetical protein
MEQIAHAAGHSGHELDIHIHDQDVWRKRFEQGAVASRIRSAVLGQSDASQVGLNLLHVPPGTVGARYIDDEQLAGWAPGVEGRRDCTREMRVERIERDQRNRQVGGEQLASLLRWQGLLSPGREPPECIEKVVRSGSADRVAGPDEHERGRGDRQRYGQPERAQRMRRDPVFDAPIELL